MKLELHLIQNFAPSNLNRDDSGSPKDCEFGGVRRARVSSQCLKRAMRNAFVDHSLLDEAEHATRTKRIVDRVAEKVAKQKGCGEDVAAKAVVKAIGGAGLKTDDSTQKTQYLLFLPKRAIAELADLVTKHFDDLLADAPAAAPPDPTAKPRTRKQEKAEGKVAVPGELRKEVVALFKNGEKTPELALFGRMISDAADWNVDAACQVAHAVSTHRVSMEFDFYTAIDDEKREDTAGSDMMGTIPFNSACFYRYLVVDTDELTRNLGEGGREQAKKTVAALVRAAVLAIPTGKQNSMAAHNLPSLVLATVKSDGESRSLTNAFVKAVRPSHDADLVAGSVHRLASHLAALDTVYGKGDRKDFFFLVDDDDTVGAKTTFSTKTGAKDMASLDGLVGAVVGAAFG